MVVPRSLVVEMHRLRIEFGRERQNLLARDVTRAISAKPADGKIFEGEHDRGENGGGGQIVAALCGNLNPLAWMARPIPAGADSDGNPIGAVSAAGFGRNCA